MAKQRPRTWETYLVKKGNKVVDGGITENLERRKGERERENPGCHVIKVGHTKTEKGARDWEKEQGFS